MTGRAATVEERFAARRRFVAGTRSSRLAAWQSDHVISLLKAAWAPAEWVSRNVSTRGDENSDRPLVEIGGRGAFTEAIETLLVEGEIDFAVHSLKDLPVRPARGLVVAAVVGPRNPGEVLVSREGRRFAELPTGAVVGTSSLRRQAQLLRARPDIEVRSIRGNVETRIAKVERGEYQATVLAAAGVERLGLDDRATEILDDALMMPAPGQGAIAVQCRADDELMIELLSEITDRSLEDRTRAERIFLASLEAGCSAPVAALAVDRAAGERGSGTASEARFHLRGRVIDPAGRRTVDIEGSGNDPLELGVRLAGEALAGGAGEILRSCSPSKGTGLLAGRRIVVTRPREQSAELAHALEAHGAQIVLLPVIRVTPLFDDLAAQRVVAELPTYRWIVLASANAARIFLGAARTAGVEWGGGVRFAAVGPATAAAAEEAGVEIAFVSRGGTGGELGKELPDVAAVRVLVPCAAKHGQGLERELESRGARVSTLPVYRTESLPIDAEGIEELKRGVDTIVFASASAVDSFLSGLGSSSVEPRSLFERSAIACIGPSTARAVERQGLHPSVVAEEHSSGGIVAALVQREWENRE